MDSDFQLDLDEVRRHLQETEVVGFYFPFLRRTLLADLRTSAVDGPFVGVVPMAKDMEDRVRSLKKLRPRFPRPASIMLVPWPRWVASLERLGVLQMLEDKLGELGGDAVRERCRVAIGELQQAERAQIRSAVTGEGYETIWSR